MATVPGCGLGATAGPKSSLALDCVRRYLYEELGPRPAHGGGLTRARALFTMLGNPHDAVASVHVAGTAGKGSVVAFIAALLRAHGFRVGAHSSPHVYSLLERFQIDGRPVAADVLLDELTRIRPAVEAMDRDTYGRPSFFEVTNAMAFGIFADRVDYSVIETGLGGLLDSTNTISRPDKFAVITPIGLAVVDRSPTAAVARAVEADAGVPVVVSGSFHLLAAVDRALGVP